MSHCLINSVPRPLATKRYDNLLCRFSTFSTSHQNPRLQSQFSFNSSRWEHRQIQQQQQIRHASSARRHRKLLNLPPTLTHGGPSHPTGSSGRSRTALEHSKKIESDHVIFDPAPTPPNPYHTPIKFLPKGDMRRVLHEQEFSTTAAPIMSMNANTTWPASAELPPEIKRNRRGPKTEKNVLGPEDVERMRALKLENEDKWTQWRLAREFNCSNTFVTKVTRVSKERREKVEAEEMEQRKFWSARRKRAHEDRQKRLAMVERDE